MKDIFNKGLPIFELIEGFNITKNGNIPVSSKVIKYVDNDLLNFLVHQVLPDYLRNIDRSNSIEQVTMVLCTAISLVRGELAFLDYDLVAIMCCYYNLGRINNPNPSTKYMSAVMELQSDSNILMKEYGIKEKDLIKISNAIEELNSYTKSNAYGMVLSDAVRVPDLDVDYLIKRVTNYVVSNYTYEPTEKLINRIYNIIKLRFRDSKSPGTIFYTPIGQNTYMQSVHNIKEILNDKDIFIERLKYLSDKEFEKKKEARG